MKRSIVIGIIVTGALLLSAVAWYLYTTTVVPKTVGGGETTEEYQTAITNLNRTFTDIYSRVDPSDSEGVRLALEVAASEATNQIERGTLLLTLAQLVTTGNLQDGVRLHKVIVADAMLPKEVRAAALLNLGFMYYSGAADATALTNEIFTTEEPYASMSPKDASAPARERAYAALLLYAETFHPTPLANAYIARYWAREAFTKTVLGEDATEDVANSEAHIARIQWINAKATYLSEDINLPMSTVQKGIAELYLAGSLDTLSGDAAVDDISAALPMLREASDRLLAQYAADDETGVLVETNIDQTTHGVWIDVLTAAVAVKETEPAAATAIADIYATYITSPEGFKERTRVIAGDGVLTPLVTSLETVSENLKNAL